MSKIFVSIACFMDNDILNTIEDCLNKAKFPNNVVFGVCLQSELSDNCLDKYKYNPQFKIKHINWSEARGPAYARGIIYDMFSNEDYFFQIDCHTRFYDNWDENIIYCFNECKNINNKAIISHYPVNINDVGKKDDGIVNISTVRCIDINMGIKTHGRFVDISLCPMKSWGISAAMLFFDRNAYHDVPFDKDIYFGLQFEEQVVLAARYWTSGYDIFTPSKHIISTEYLTNRSRQKRSVIRIPSLQKETYERLCHIMKLKYNSKYENSISSRLGNERSIEDYYKMLKIYDKVRNTYPDNYLDNIINKNTINSLNCDNDIPVIVIGNKNLIDIKDEYDMNVSYFDKIKIDNNKYNEYVNEGVVINDRYNLRLEQVSLWLSHFGIWEKMIKDNTNKLLILEDTCKFVSNFTEMYNSILTKSKFLDYDILYLGYSGVSAKSKDLSLTDTGCPRLTSSYILTLSGAKKLVEKLSLIDYPFDELLGSLFLRKEINGYRATQLLTYQEFQLNKPDLYHII